MEQINIDKETLWSDYVGVIVARFQVDELHEGHKDLLDFITDRHAKVIVVLGLSPIKCTHNNPLDFEARKQMLLQAYPDLSIFYLKDTPSDELWSERLDEIISDNIGPHQNAILYGSRDSFIPYYHGRYTTYEYEPTVIVSGTEIRRIISAKTKASADFRKGVIWAVNNQYPCAIPTIDVAIVDIENKRLLLGRKRDEDNYRFIGGFCSPGETWEETAAREMVEESGLKPHNLTYIGSYFINDWRFKDTISKITTTFFITTDFSGRAKPGDDIDMLKWFNLNEILEEDVVDNHIVLLHALRNHLGLR